MSASAHFPHLKSIVGESAPGSSHASAAGGAVPRDRVVMESFQELGRAFAESEGELKVERERAEHLSRELVALQLRSADDQDKAKFEIETLRKQIQKDFDSWRSTSEQNLYDSYALKEERNVLRHRLEAVEKEAAHALGALEKNHEVRVREVFQQIKNEADKRVLEATRELEQALASSQARLTDLRFEKDRLQVVLQERLRTLTTEASLERNELSGRALRLQKQLDETVAANRETIEALRAQVAESGRAFESLRIEESKFRSRAQWLENAFEVNRAQTQERLQYETELRARLERELVETKAELHRGARELAVDFQSSRHSAAEIQNLKLRAADLEKELEDTKIRHEGIVADRENLRDGLRRLEFSSAESIRALEDELQTARLDGAEALAATKSAAERARREYEDLTARETNALARSIERLEAEKRNLLDAHAAEQKLIEGRFAGERHAAEARIESERRAAQSQLVAERALLEAAAAQEKALLETRLTDRIESLERKIAELSADNTALRSERADLKKNLERVRAALPSNGKRPI